MENETMEKEKIYFSQIVAGALLKFKELDVVDIRLILNELIESNIANIYCSTGIGILRGYMKNYLNGVFALDKPLDYFISDENCTLEEYLTNLEGNKIKDYFDKLDIDKLREKKRILLDEQKDLILKSANILLISDNEDDYNALLKYGFKNVDYFKSIIRADKYFAEHPEELEKYHIILTGEQSVKHCCLESHVDIENKISSLARKKNIIETHLFTYLALEKISLFLQDNKTNLNWQVEESSYDKAFDKLVECASLNQIVDKSSLEKFIPIEDYINTNRLPLPTKKKDLKILCLVTHPIDDSDKELAESLGLNITFKPDSNAGLGRYVKSNLGDYDIIITSDLHSSLLTTMGIESTEQCKDTGRDLTLLMVYKEGATFDRYLSNKAYSIYANNVHLYYTYGGNIAPSLYHLQADYTTLIPDATYENDSHTNYNLEKKQILKSIIESAVILYSDALKQSKNLEIEDLDFMSPEDYTTEYKNHRMAVENLRLQQLKPLQDFDNFTRTISNYLNFKSEGLIHEEIPGLNIIESEEGITVESILNGRVLCSISYSKNYPNENYRVFTIQTLNKKGNLGNPELVGLYSMDHKKSNSTPKKPDERQLEAVEAIYKKIRKYIQPLNDEASEKYQARKQGNYKALRKNQLS